MAAWASSRKPAPPSICATSRITPIYEGTNGIQALTLLRRGLLRDQGAALGALLDEAAAADFATPALLHALQHAREAADWLRRAEPRDAEAGATPFLGLVGTAIAGWLCGPRARPCRGAGFRPPRRRGIP